jgi:hypothetical protein
MFNENHIRLMVIRGSYGAPSPDSFFLVEQNHKLNTSGIIKTCILGDYEYIIALS